MTPHEWVSCFTLLRAAYPSFFRSFGQVDVQAWYELLKDLDGALTVLAIGQLVQIRPYPPSIACIRQRVAEIEAPRRGAT